MSNVPEKQIPKQIELLLLQAEDETRKYKWDKAIEILKNVGKISTDEKLKEIEGDVFYKLGEIYQIAADYGKNKDNIINKFQSSILNFQKAKDAFKESNQDEKIDTCLGNINILKYIAETEKGKEEDLLESAQKYFNAAKQVNLRKGNITDSIKMGILECRALELLIGEKLLRLDEHAPLILVIECEDLIENTWEEIKNQPNFPEIYLYYFLNSILEYYIWLVAYFSAEKLNINLQIIDHLNRMKEIISYLENSKKNLSLFFACSISAIFNLIYAIYHVNNQFEQKKYIKLAQKWLKKAEVLLPEINSNTALSLFYYTRFNIAIRLISLGYFSKDIKDLIKDLNLCINSLSVSFPKIIVSHFTLYTAGIFIIGSFNPYLPNDQRINMVQRAQNIIKSATDEISIIGNPIYKIIDLELDYFKCTINTMLGDLIKDSREKTKHFSIASEIFDNISDYSHQNLNHTQIYSQFLNSISRIGITLSKNSIDNSEKVKYYQKAINVQLKSQKMLINVDLIGNLFLIGSTYYKLGKLTDDDTTLKKSYLAYNDAIEYCNNRGYFNLVGSAYVNLAKIEDRRGSFLSASNNYEKAINSFDKAIMTLSYSKLSRKIHNLKNYINAWKIIERAKSFHANEDHNHAQLNYEEASQILKEVSKYSFEAPFYFAWAYLEKAENLSKKNMHQEAAATYLVSKSYFEEAKEILNSSSSKRKSQEENERILNLIKAAEIRKTYCTARHQIETARLESKNGNHLPAAELYNKASFLFENICEKFRIKKEKDELTAIFHLCKAWENMERAVVEGTPSLYKTASNLFQKAAGYFPESRMKKLSIGNSHFCSALENRDLFDKSTEIDEKIKFYKKIKMFLRESSKNYQLGGFVQDAQWSLATSTFFDGIWHLILSDNEIDFTKKQQYLNIATRYLNNALQIFINAGYHQKKEDILSYLEMVKSEKEILTSALDVIEKPEISASSVGISAPSCPVEISSSINYEEMQQTDLTTESELNWRQRIIHIYFFLPQGICLYDHSFKREEDIEPQLVAGGLSGISAIIQEVTKDKTNIKKIEQEEMTLLLEHGKYLSVALLTEENLVTLQKKLGTLIQDVEDFYQEELETYSGNLTVFSKIGKFVQKIFES
ncbi:MAG: hypothetical protein HWN67_00025 [Candidatus Helarchaeota archaeon]|nr:hypothetical protein [Candidatus Helarchaeota archaeon]